MRMYDDTEGSDYMQHPCPFVRYGECEIPPCNDWFIEGCIGRQEKDGQEGAMKISKMNTGSTAGSGSMLTDTAHSIRYRSARRSGMRSCDRCA